MYLAYKRSLASIHMHMHIKQSHVGKLIRVAPIEANSASSLSIRCVKNYIPLKMLSICTRDTMNIPDSWKYPVFVRRFFF
jgi:hypothetical protein